VSGGRLQVRFRSAQQRDGGFTLSEMLVVLVIFGIIGGIVATVVRVGLTHQTQIEARNGAMADARKVIQRVDRDIRSAFLDKATTPSAIVLDEYLNGVTAAPTVVTYSVSTTPGASSSQLNYQACATCTAQVLITNLVPTSTSPVFSFGSTYDYSTSQPAADAGTVNNQTCAYVANPTQIKSNCVGVITVHLLVQPPTLNGPVNVGDGGTELRNSA
jgi:prepilin-type N-terminal cleavage/methylation domain-containing protein